MVQTEQSRRSFLKAASAMSLGFVGVQRLLAANGTGVGSGLSGLGISGDLSEGFGPLVADPAGIIDLPRGFTYSVLGRRGERMADGLLVPGLADGMACFEGPDDDTVVLVCNHEVRTGDLVNSGFGLGGRLLSEEQRGKLYDRGRERSPVLGGTSNIVYNLKEARVERRFMSLGGTIRNCAGGRTPWGSWLTCEEDVTRANDQHEQDHGWVFEVPATAEIGMVDPTPIRGMGRFNHEAIAIDPNSGVVYLTEDRGDGLLYRYVPTTPGELLAGGRLEVLAVRDRPSLDTRNWMGRDVAIGDELTVEWLPIDNIEAPDDDLRIRGFRDGAARFARGEGIDWATDAGGNGAVYIICTNGGPARKGQVFKYVPSDSEGAAGEQQKPATLTLFVEPNDGDVLDMPDNCCGTPWGGLMLCEDGSGEDLLIGVTPEGRLYRFAKNSQSEFAGACFSPDGSTLFVNIQGPSLTLAIRGPWDTLRA